ncbi:MAG: hypothetical protein F6J99_34020 [Moorea sp. SIO4G3]|nr:hypothetical protein [Moorena sp. SIO4G3]
MGETTAVAHGGNPLWRRCLPKTAQITLINKFYPFSAFEVTVRIRQP